ncbi:putative transmembrane protein [Pusillimonas sp. T7-7]|uniref:TRAP transporter large permease n=1 Tax=Pusillimonas sp. (strain T7-7) TaxID=1007105 RepID=UPI0002084F8F|nr:TRAP transporter large permease [Pusillimonas sp. T7-7]AEC21816.1 putative transmembrane protein [Pusillimonas sp. T7-7]
MTFLMLAIFLVLLVLAMPVGFALVISSGIAVITAGGMPSVVAVVKLFQPTQSFPLLAIPFFILSGNLMMGGVLGKKLIEFATALVGRFHGGLGQVSVVGCTIFGGVSGSAVAEASALGSMIIPWQKRVGYPPAFGAASIAASSVIAGLIPPSIPLILYASVANESIAALFLAGVLPGLMLCVGFMLVCYFSGRWRNFPRLAQGMTFKGILRTTVAALPALIMPILILVLLRGGIATPTEVSVVAVAYGFIVSALVYRDLSVKRVYDALVGTAVTTGVVMLVIAASNLVGYVLIMEDVPNMAAKWTMDVLKSPELVILMMNFIMLFVGMFLDLPAAILLLGPTFVAMANEIGLDTVQLGVVMAINLSIGLFTPPVGTTLFIAAAISKERVGAIVKELWPFYAVAILVLGMLSYFPVFTLY